MQVKKKKKAGKYAGIVEDFGIKIENEAEQEYIRESPKILGSPVEIPDSFNSLEQRVMHLNLIAADTTSRTVTSLDRDSSMTVDKQRKPSHPLTLVE